MVCGLWASQAYSGKEAAAVQEMAGPVPGSGSSPGEGHGTPLQYSCLGNPMGGGAWRAAVHGASKSQTRLSTGT